MDRMIEHGAGMKTISVFIIKPLLAALVALGWWPIADFVLLQVNDYALLNPWVMMLLNELKTILGIIISIAVLIKLVMGISKMGKKEKK